MMKEKKKEKLRVRLKSRSIRGLGLPWERPVATFSRVEDALLLLQNTLSQPFSAKYFTLFCRPQIRTSPETGRQRSLKSQRPNVSPTSTNWTTQTGKQHFTAGHFLASQLKPWKNMFTDDMDYNDDTAVDNSKYII